MNYKVKISVMRGAIAYEILSIIKSRGDEIKLPDNKIEHYQGNSILMPKRLRIVGDEVIATCKDHEFSGEDEMNIRELNIENLVLLLEIVKETK
jgi:hypothetical protein